MTNTILQMRKLSLRDIDSWSGSLCHVVEWMTMIVLPEERPTRRVLSLGQEVALDMTSLLAEALRTPTMVSDPKGHCRTGTPGDTHQHRPFGNEHHCYGVSHYPSLTSHRE
jgi:hypothetical protein